MEKRINSWLRKYGKTFADGDGGFMDCDMVDSCLNDLELGEDARRLVNKLVDLWIVNH